MLPQSQSANTHINTPILHDQNLSHRSNNLNCNENRVIAEILKYIQLPGVQFTRVYLVKLLHKHKHVEKDSAMLQKLWMISNHIIHID